MKYVLFVELFDYFRVKIMIESIVKTVQESVIFQT